VCIKQETGRQGGDAESLCCHVGEQQE
jgi:hypothetical protein